MRKSVRLFLLILFFSNELVAQGFYNHVWLLGNNPFSGFPNGRIVFDSSSYIHTPEMRKMSFLGTEATICNSQGNFLMSSNGIWIANANNDTMLNGSGLNPNGVTSNWAFGLPMTANNMFLPYPGDTTKYLLYHHTATYNGYSYPAYELYESLIDINMDNGLGGVVTKNQQILNDTLNWGITACKHANGRDWWIVASKHNTDTMFVLLRTEVGIINISIQKLGMPRAWYVTTQPTFSISGDKFCYAIYDSATVNNYVVISDFDRCTGHFSNTNVIQVTSGQIIWGLGQSNTNKFFYACSSTRIFQINIDSLTVDTVATYDGFISPPNQTCCATSFWNMYLAANGKIYITSGSSVQHIHEMNFPDSAGLACDVQQHAIDLGSYRHGRAVPNHPNYNLGPVVGSVCDSITSVAEIKHNFKFSISPNPTSDGTIKLVYLLPQNKNGVFEVYNMTGQLVYKMNLPPWSTLQFVKLPELSSGVYTCVIRSGYERVGKKLVVMK